MAGKKTLTDEELLAQFDDIPAQDATPNSSESSNSKSSNAQHTPTGPEDPLADLETLTKRPHTPKSSTLPSRPSKSDTATPPSTGSARTSEEKQQGLSNTAAPAIIDKATSNDAMEEKGALTRSSHEQKSGQTSTKSQQEKEQSSGGWWGGIFATASAAVKQAEAAVKEIQNTEEAQRLTEQVKGNVGALRDFGGELRSRAIPTFSNLLHTIAPPISRHERLQIHITHDFVGYPSLDPMIYQTFSRVMAQVEGGDLLVIQRGSESTQKRSSETGASGSDSSGWNDGPWWRQIDGKRSIGAVKGFVEGTKLVRANAEAYANDFFAAHGGVEEAAKRATAVLNEESPVRSSDIFLAIQAVSHMGSDDLFQGPPEAKSKNGVDEPKEDDELLSFALYLHDPIHGLSFKTLSQSVPQRWINWLDAPPVAADSGDAQPPEEIQEIIRDGGIDPRDWVSEWIEETLTLGVGIVAQRYVARRMGVGEGGFGRGKKPEHVIESGAGEAARVL